MHVLSAAHLVTAGSTIVMITITITTWQVDQSFTVEQ